MLNRRMKSYGLASALVAVAAAAGALPIPAARANPPWWEGWSMDDARLSQPIYTEEVFEHFKITAGDGVLLDGAVLRPVVPDGVRVPTILRLSPYLPNSLQPKDMVSPTHKLDRYVERGYALAAVSVRGFGGSGGCPDYQGDLDRADIDPIMDTIASLPWSDGNIGAIGLSWEGTTQVAAAVAGNPHLKTIVPAAPNVDWYTWSFLDGIPSWYTGYTFNIYAPPAVWSAFGPGPAPARADTAGCPAAVPTSIVAGAQSAPDGARNAWWDERDQTRYLDGINPDLAVLHVQGARDDPFIDNLDRWDRGLRQRLPNYRLIYGNWMHLWPDTPNVQAFENPDVEFNPHPLTSWKVLLLRWFDRWLKGVDTGIEAMPPALVQDNRGRWHAESGLEPGRGVTHRLFPAAGGTVASVAGDGLASFVDNGENVDPGGTCTYYGGGFRVGCVPVDQPNAQYFRTEPFTTERRFSGIARMHLNLVHSAPRGQVGVTLYEVDRNRWTPMTYGFASFGLRDSEYESKPVEPGQAFQQTVTLLARDFVVREGNQLGIAIGAQVGRNPRGLAGNGYLPVPSGGQTDILLGAGSLLEIDELDTPTQILPLK